MNMVIGITLRGLTFHISQTVSTEETYLVVMYGQN